MDGLWKIIIVTLILAVISGLAAILIFPRNYKRIEVTPGYETDKSEIRIYGAVEYPGIYDYEGNIRIDDAVSLAGGYAKNADIIHANGSKWVTDGETIIIPTVSLLEPTLTLPIPEEQKVNINTASKSELIKLPGIGEKRADEIIKMREQIGKFNSREDLLLITGISEKLLESIYDRLIVD